MGIEDTNVKEQWLLEGYCILCKRKNYCSTQCTPRKTKLKKFGNYRHVLHKVYRSEEYLKEEENEED